MLIKSEGFAERQQQQASNEDLTAVKNDENDVRTQERLGVSRKIINDDIPTNNSNSTRIHNFDRRLGKVSTFSDITEIAPHLLLCGAVALRGNVLENLNVSCVINATTELPDTPLPNLLEKDILYLRVNIDDKTDSNILPWLDLVTDVIHQVKTSGGRTLIHCVAGISRSATLCLAYLIKYEGYTLRDSYLLLKSLRQIIRPNSGFFGQLVEFEKEVTGKQTVSMVHSHFTNTWIPQVYEDEFRRFEELNRHRRRIRP